MPDFGFIGPSYETPSIYQDAQECINYYPEIDPLKAPGSRGVVALYPTPGLTQWAQLVNAPVRGMRALSGGNILIAVAGNTVYSINTSLTITTVGTLTTTTGVVVITDNIVSTSGLLAYIVDGPNRYTLDVSTNTLTQLPSTDGAWQGATVCDVIDNYIIYNQPNTQNFGATDLSSALSTNQYFGSKDGSPDSLVSLIADHRQVYLLGEVTSEVWVDVGNVIAGIVTFPFQRIQGTSMQHGCAAPYSVARFAEQFMFVSKDTRGQITIGMIQGYQFQRLSTHAVEQSLTGQVVSDAIAYTYRIEGHEFYVVTFPTADITWAYDLASQMWHKWLSVDSYNNFHRHRSNCYAFFNGLNLVGDYQNGKIYSLDNDVYTDNGSTIRRVRRAPHLVSDLQRQYFDELQIQFQPGVGLNGFTANNQNQSSIITIYPADTYLIAPSQTVIIYAIYTINGNTLGADPQAMLRWSNDGGSTWSNEHWTSIGKIGRYKNRAIWRRLGFSRDRIFEVVVTDPVKAVIISANLKASTGDN